MNASTKITIIVASAAVIIVALVAGGTTLLFLLWMQPAGPKSLVVTDSEPQRIDLPPTDAAVAQARSNLATAGARSPRGRAQEVAVFSGVRWRGDVPEVQVSGTWYELISLDDLPAAKIVEFAQNKYGNEQVGTQVLWKKRFSEDLGDVTAGMGHPLGATVNLQLRQLDTSDTISRADVPLTPENRRSIISMNNPH